MPLFRDMSSASMPTLPFLGLESGALVSAKPSSAEMLLEQKRTQRHSGAFPTFRRKVRATELKSSS